MSEKEKIIKMLMIHYISLKKFLITIKMFKKKFSLLQKLRETKSKRHEDEVYSIKEILDEMIKKN